MQLHWSFGGAACALVLLSGCGGGFKEFSSAEGKFKVQMPGTPKEQPINAAGASGKMFTVEEKAGAYNVTFGDTPIPDKETPEQIESRLDGSRQGMVANIKAKMTEEKKIKLDDKYPGREVTAELPDKKGILRARIYLVGKRLYQVMVIGTPDFANSANATRFLDSFQLTS